MAYLGGKHAYHPTSVDVFEFLAFQETRDFTLPCLDNPFYLSFYAPYYLPLIDYIYGLTEEPPTFLYNPKIVSTLFIWPETISLDTDLSETKTVKQVRRTLRRTAFLSPSEKRILNQSAETDGDIHLAVDTEPSSLFRWFWF